MCSSSRSDSVIIVDQNRILYKVSGINNKKVPDSATNQPINFARLPAIVLRKIFAELDDYESFRNLVSVSRQMYHIAGPYLQAKRKQIMDEPRTRAHRIEHCRHLLFDKEWDLKLWLLENKYKTYNLHGIAFDDGQQIVKMLAKHTIVQLDPEEQSYQLLQLAKYRCNEFRDYYDRKVSTNIARLKKKYALSAKTAREIEIAFYCYPLLKKFVRQNPELCFFTDLDWPGWVVLPKEVIREKFMPMPRKKAQEDGRWWPLVKRIFRFP